MKKIGIITFHNSYNCGSMLETYAIHHYLEKINVKSEIINFSSNGQKQLYSTLEKKITIKNIIKNILVFPHRKKIDNNNRHYERFKTKNFKLSREYGDDSIIIDNYSVVIAGSDQIWNITIPDSSDKYFLNWVKSARRVAYAPSFGAKDILKYSSSPDKYKKYLENFDALSIREENGKKWIKNLIKKDVPILIDPTLLLERRDYDKIIDNNITPAYEYIFFYCPSFDIKICKFVKRISIKYNLPVIVWSTKSYYKKLVYIYGFKLPEYESPSVYLSLIKNAKLILTTSFHGTIFSTIYKKKFYTIKNGGMYKDDDRVITLLKQLGMEERLISYKFNAKYNYFNEVDYSQYDKKLPKLKQTAIKYIEDNVVKYYGKS